MDLQCPAVIICLTPEDDVPASAGGHRIVAAYAYGMPVDDLQADVPSAPAPLGPFWTMVEQIADRHRGEAVALVAPLECLAPNDLRGVTLSVDSGGPVRLGAVRPVDNS